MGLLKTITDFIMPIDLTTTEDERDQVETKKTEAPAASAKKVEMPTAANATTGAASGAVDSELGAARRASAATTGVAGYGSALKFSDPVSSAAPNVATASVRTPLTVIDSRSKELTVKIYSPTEFDQASEIAAEILGKNAAIVNYEYVDASVQLRLCDFLNGVCYVTDGYTDKISEKIFLYVPDGVETLDIAEAMSSMSSAQIRRGIFAS